MKDAIKHLKYFIGKAVTVITTAINRDFDERQKCDYFLGVVESVDELGIMTLHPITGCKNYYFYSQICAISEEQVLHPEKPEDAELIAELKERQNKPIVVPPVETPTNNPFVDVDSLSQMRKRYDF
jgi:hypothetical protein